MNEIITQIQMHALVFAMCSIITLLFVLIDLCDGVRTARLIGERVRSHKLRDTLTKFFSYWLFILCGALVDVCGVCAAPSYWSRPYVTLVLTIIAGIIEIHSLKEHADKRKDDSAKIEKVLKKIVEASTKKEAQEILPKIAEILTALKDK